MRKTAKAKKKSALTSHIQTRAKAKAKPFIGIKEEAESYLITNQHISTGYRINFNSRGSALKSLFMLHNETGNVWTHLIGACIFVWLTCYLKLYLHAPSLEKHPITYGVCAHESPFDI